MKKIFPKYKVVCHDPIHDIWMLEKRFLGFLYFPVSAGRNSTILAWLAANNITDVVFKKP